MVTSIIIIGILEYIIGVVLVCYEKQKLGSALMLLSPVGLAIFVYLGVRIGVVESARIYLSTLWYTFSEN